MDASKNNELSPTKNRANIERKSEREMTITRTVDGPARLVFDAWAKPELFRRWWVPKSFGITVVSWDADVRPGGKYRLVFSRGDSGPMPFFGTYVEVTPHSRLAWTNDEGEHGQVITTVTFEEKAGKTQVVVHELYPSKQALEDELASGAKDCMGETFDQLDELLRTL